MKEAYEQSCEKQSEIGEFVYTAQSWDIPRRPATRLEYGAQGVNPRFIVSNLLASHYSNYSDEAFYDGLYCQRGEAENRIKETQRDAFGVRELPALQGQSVSRTDRRTRLHLDARRRAPAARDIPVGRTTAQRDEFTAFPR